MRTRVPFFELQEFRPTKTDWAQVIRELNGAGITGEAIAAALGRSDSAIDKWKNNGASPRHEDGQALLAMHRKYCVGMKR